MERTHLTSSTQRNRDQGNRENEFRHVRPYNQPQAEAKRISSFQNEAHLRWFSVSYNWNNPDEHSHVTNATEHGAWHICVWCSQLVTLLPDKSLTHISTTGHLIHHSCSGWGKESASPGFDIRLGHPTCLGQ